MMGKHYARGSVIDMLGISLRRLLSRNQPQTKMVVFWKALLMLLRLYYRSDAYLMPLRLRHLKSVLWIWLCISDLSIYNH